MQQQPVCAASWLDTSRPSSCGGTHGKQLCSRRQLHTYQVVSQIYRVRIFHSSFILHSRVFIYVRFWWRRWNIIIGVVAALYVHVLCALHCVCMYCVHCMYKVHKWMCYQ